MWTADNRPRYNRDKLRYPSDLTDAEWAHIEPLIPPGKPGGGKPGLVFCPPAEHRELMSGLAIPFSMWQCAGHGDAAGPGFVR